MSEAQVQGGAQKGKYELYGEEAWELYVRGGKTPMEISRILGERHGEDAPSDVAVGKWKTKWDWDADRQKHVDENRRTGDIKTRVVSLAMKTLDRMEEKVKDGGYLDNADWDKVSKAMKAAERLNDPGSERRIAIRVATSLIDHLNERCPDLVPELKEPLREFLNTIGD